MKTPYAVRTCVAGGESNRYPARCAVDTASEPLLVDKGLRQQRSDAMYLMPIISQAAGGRCQYLRAEVVRRCRVEEQESRVEENQVAASLTLQGCPPDPCFAGGVPQSAFAPYEEPEPVIWRSCDMGHLAQGATNQVRDTQVVLIREGVLPPRTFMLLQKPDLRSTGGGGLGHGGHHLPAEEMSSTNTNGQSHTRLRLS